ncbi:MAG: methyltransferase domain-containing protein [Candidatus Paceibacterota bacterium]
MPSSNFLARRMAQPIGENETKLVVVELGPGTGAFTRFTLNILPSDARLITIEMNPVLKQRLSQNISDPRCEIVAGDASDLPKILAEKGIAKVDYIISGIPLGNLDEVSRKKLYNAVKMSLKKDGVYTQFQYFMANFAEIKKHFSVTHLAWEWRNIPPAFVYTCKLL